MYLELCNYAFRTQFMKNSSNTEAELKKRVAYKKKCVPFFRFFPYRKFMFSLEWLKRD